jgi:7-cyano-7-deazaguanine synthase
MRFSIYMGQNEVLVLHSGGVDSTALINFFLKLNTKVISMHVNYGQLSARNESKAVKKICKHYDIHSKKITLKSGNLFKDGFIQGRNIFLLSSALLTASFINGQIALGIHDGTDYIDCGTDFLKLSNKIFTLYTNGRILVSAPFIKWNKKQILNYCHKESVPLDLTYSCELGLNQPCGKCPSCKELILINGSTYQQA